MFLRRNGAGFLRSRTLGLKSFVMKTWKHGLSDWIGVTPALGGFDGLAIFFFFFQGVIVVEPSIRKLLSCFQ